KELCQCCAVESRHWNHRDNPANTQQQQGKKDARLQLRDFEAVGESVDDGLDHAPDLLEASGPVAGFAPSAFAGFLAALAFGAAFGAGTVADGFSGAAAAFGEPPITSQVPPLASIFDLAEALKACAFTVSFLFKSPLPRILIPSARPLA